MGKPHIYSEDGVDQCPLMAGGFTDSGRRPYQSTTDWAGRNLQKNPDVRNVAFCRATKCRTPEKGQTIKPTCVGFIVSTRDRVTGS